MELRVAFVQAARAAVGPKRARARGMEGRCIVGGKSVGDFQVVMGSIGLACSYEKGIGGFYTPALVFSVLHVVDIVPHGSHSFGPSRAWHISAYPQNVKYLPPNDAHCLRMERD